MSAWISRTAVIAGVLCAGRIESRAESPCAAVRCAAGTHCQVFDGNLARCVPNVPPKNPCAAVRCVAGTHCQVFKGNLARCVPKVPPKNPCATVRCAAGTHCEERNGQAGCYPNGPGH